MSLGPDDHVSMDTLRRYAAAALPPAHAVLVEEHLDECADGRCAAFLEAETAAVARHARTFQSREIVWSAFESLARELGVPIDELVDEAMEQFATSRGYRVGGAAREVLQPQPRPFAAPRGGEARAAAPLLSSMSSIEETVDARGIATLLDRSYGDVAAAGEEEEEGLERTRLRQRFSRPPASAPPETRPATSRPPASSAPAPRPAASRPPSAHGSSGRLSQRELEAKRLFLTYLGRTHEVDKDRYLLGRSKTQSDLRLDDANVSRQHAVIERVGSAWYVVDLGSTNGVLVAGERVARRALADGDLIVITTHEIRCSLR